MVLAILLAYIVGSIPFALLMAKRAGFDLRRIGSGNIGAANVMRASGVRAGILVALLDVSKGAAGVMIAERLSAGPTGTAIAGFAAVAGHIYPIWMRFRGGKGVATACGVCSVLVPAAVPPAVAIFFITVGLTKYVSAGSVLATLIVPPVAYALGSPAPSVIAASAVSALIIFRHRSNLGRLRAGTERRLGLRA
jgi:glycerol-3-phosphate acyltransferase PlsY